MNAAGDIKELGLKRIKYWDAAPNTSNIVDNGDETKADDRFPPLLDPFKGCEDDEEELDCEDEPTVFIEVDELRPRLD